MLSTPIGRLRVLGWFEGASYLLLLGVAMPLKYLAGHPEMVSVVGMAHGVLFVLYVLGAIMVSTEHKWPVSRLGLAFLAAVMPFGPFVFDRYVLDKEGLPSGEPAA